MKYMTHIVLALFVSGTALFADALAIAREEIGRQTELLKKGNVNALRARITDRLKDRVTKDSVKKAQKQLKEYTLDDLVESVEEGEYQGERTIKIKMKNGRTLTTLVERDGQWYADTIWFR